MNVKRVTANVVPIFTKGDWESAFNYWPASLIIMVYQMLPKGNQKTDGSLFAKERLPR